MRTPKPTPRFLPTLTEVVQPPPPPPHGEFAQARPQPEIDADAMVDQVMRAVAPLVQAQLRDMVSKLVESQLQEMTPRIEQDLATMVRLAVQGALEEIPRPPQDEVRPSST
jgi:hypothetical protein